MLGAVGRRGAAEVPEVVLWAWRGGGVACKWQCLKSGHGERGHVGFKKWCPTTNGRLT